MTTFFDGRATGCNLCFTPSVTQAEREIHFWKPSDLRETDCIKRRKKLVFAREKTSKESDHALRRADGGKEKIPKQSIALGKSAEPHPAHNTATVTYFAKHCSYTPTQKSTTVH